MFKMDWLTINFHDHTDRKQPVFETFFIAESTIIKNDYSFSNKNNLKTFKQYLEVARKIP